MDIKKNIKLTERDLWILVFAMEMKFISLELANEIFFIKISGDILIPLTRSFSLERLTLMVRNKLLSRAMDLNGDLFYIITKRGIKIISNKTPIELKEKWISNRNKKSISTHPLKYHKNIDFRQLYHDIELIRIRGVLYRYTKLDKTFSDKHIIQSERFIRWYKKINYRVPDMIWLFKYKGDLKRVAIEYEHSIKSSGRDGVLIYSYLGVKHLVDKRIHNTVSRKGYYDLSNEYDRVFIVCGDLSIYERYNKYLENTNIDNSKVIIIMINEFKELGKNILVDKYCLGKI
jgi:hypothetical protein